MVVKRRPSSFQAEGRDNITRRRSSGLLIRGQPCHLILPCEDVQYLLGHSTPDMVRRYSATYNSEKAARAHEQFSPADRLGERLSEGAHLPPATSLT